MVEKHIILTSEEVLIVEIVFSFTFPALISTKISLSLAGMLIAARWLLLNKKRLIAMPGSTDPAGNQLVFFSLGAISFITFICTYEPILPRSLDKQLPSDIEKSTDNET